MTNEEILAGLGPPDADGFLRIVRAKPEPHRCATPDPSPGGNAASPKFAYDTIWRCDECGRSWKLIYLMQVGVGYYVCRWRPFPRWYDRLLGI